MKEIDLFEHYDELPEEVQQVVDKYCDGGDQTYERCRALKLELEAIGYTCDYGLDADPYGLKKN